MGIRAARPSTQLLVGIHSFHRFIHNMGWVGFGYQHSVCRSRSAVAVDNPRHQHPPIDSPGRARAKCIAALSTCTPLDDSTNVTDHGPPNSVRRRPTSPHWCPHLVRLPTRPGKNFSSRAPGVMIADARFSVSHLTVGGDRAGERRSMATHSYGPGSTPSPKSHSGSPTWNHAYVIAALRAGLIALALLGVLAPIVLY